MWYTPYDRLDCIHRHGLFDRCRTLQIMNVTMQYRVKLSLRKLLFHTLKHHAVSYRNLAYNLMQHKWNMFGVGKKFNTSSNINTYRKYSNKFFNKNGTINGVTTSNMKFRIPINRYSGQNVLRIAFKSDGFDFLSHSSRHFLSQNKDNFVAFKEHFSFPNYILTLNQKYFLILYLSSRLPSTWDWSAFSGSFTSLESKTLPWVRLKTGIVQAKNKIESQLALWRGFGCNFLLPDSIFFTAVSAIRCQFSGW